MHIVIIEDEPMVAQRIERLTRHILKDSVKRITAFANLDDAAGFLAHSNVDVVMLDLNLQGRNGFELLEQNVAAGYHTIVVSANTDSALQAFEYGILDFVAKPFTEARLSKAFSRLLDNQQRSHYGCRYLSIKKHFGVELVEIKDISHIQAEKHYTLIYGPTKEPLLHSKSIENLVKILPENFFRIHRSYIVNMNMAKQVKIHSGSRYELQLKSGEVLPIGRTRYKNVKEILDF